MRCPTTQSFLILLSNLNTCFFSFTIILSKASFWNLYIWRATRHYALTYICIWVSFLLYASLLLKQLIWCNVNSLTTACHTAARYFEFSWGRCTELCKSLVEKTHERGISSNSSVRATLNFGWKFQRAPALWRWFWRQNFRRIYYNCISP